MTSSFLELSSFRTQWRALHQGGDEVGVQSLLKTVSLSSAPGALIQLPLELQEKLQSFGREWEIKIAELALHDRASFFSLSLSVSIESANDVHHEIEAKLLQPSPWGVFLFCEAANSDSIRDGVWQGIYYFTTLPHRKPADLQLESMAGVKSIGSPILYETH